MQDKTIRDYQITASSFWSTQHAPYHARLHNVGVAGISTGSWSVGVENTPRYLQIDLLKTTVITKIATQGRPKIPQWVKEFQLAYSKDNITWVNYEPYCHKAQGLVSLLY